MCAWGGGKKQKGVRKTGVMSEKWGYNKIKHRPKYLPISLAGNISICSYFPFLFKLQNLTNFLLPFFNSQRAFDIP